MGRFALDGVMAAKDAIKAALSDHLSVPDLVKILSAKGGSLRLQETLKARNIDLDVIVGKHNDLPCTPTL